MASSEPSAALDPRAEAELFDRIHALSGSTNTGKKTTTIYISHRFSTGMSTLVTHLRWLSHLGLVHIVRRADKIAVVDKVRVRSSPTPKSNTHSTLFSADNCRIWDTRGTLGERRNLCRILQPAKRAVRLIDLHSYLVHAIRYMIQII